MIAIVTDSTADISQERARELGITVVPLSVNFGSQSFRDGIDMSADQFYRRLVESETLPTTSQPSVGAFEEVYRRLAATADGIVSVHLAGNFSGTIRSAQQARDLLEGGPSISIIDTGSVSMGCGFLAIKAAEAAQRGASLEEIERLVRERIPQVRVFAGFDTLKYLEKGGRIGKSRALLGTLLNVKPIVQIRDGEVHPYEQVRTMKRAVGRLIELARQNGPYEEFAVLYSTSEEHAREIADQLSDLHPRDRIVLSQLGIVVGTHAGPGTLGFVGLKQS